MNSRQIMEKYKALENEINELSRGLDALGDEVGEDSQAYILVEKVFKEKQLELRKFSVVDWVEKEEDEII